MHVLNKVYEADAIDLLKLSRITAHIILENEV